MLKLTDTEKSMLNGERGRLGQAAMEVVVRYGEILGAESLCTVSKAHLFAGYHMYLRALDSLDAESLISTMHFCSREKLVMDSTACFSITDAGPMDRERWRELGIDENTVTLNNEFIEIYKRAGIHDVGTCAPYLTGFIPMPGEHYVSTESHAIVLMNSLWGACANADGIELAFCSAVCGRTPLWGNHTKAGRRGTHLFRVIYEPTTPTDWDVLGYAVGLALPSFSTPVVCGDFPRPDIDEIRSFCTALATSSGAEMCHIVGVTPEAPDIPTAIGGCRPDGCIDITRKDMKSAFDMLCAEEDGEVDFVSIGCPHCSIGQIKSASDFLRGKRISPGVELQIWTAYPIKTIADRCGYTGVIESAGGRIFCESCPNVSDMWPKNARGLAFDSAKQADCISAKARGHVYYGSMTDCLESAVTGKWVNRPWK